MPNFLPHPGIRIWQVQNRSTRNFLLYRWAGGAAARPSYKQASCGGISWHLRAAITVLFFWGGKISKCSDPTPKKQKKKKEKKGPWQEGTKEFFGKNPQYQVAIFLGFRV